jgi:hypothetical protein
MVRYECYRDDELVTKQVWEANPKAYEVFLREEPILEIETLDQETGRTIIRIIGREHQVEHEFISTNPDFQNMVSCIKLELEEIGIVVRDS